MVPFCVNNLVGVTAHFASLKNILQSTFSNWPPIFLQGTQKGLCWMKFIQSLWREILGRNSSLLCVPWLHGLHYSPLWSMAIGLLKGAPFNPAKKVNISRAIGRRWFSSVWRTSKECPKSPKSTPLYPVPCPPYFLYIVFVLQTPFQYLAHTWTTFWGTQRPQVAESGLPSARGFVQSIAIM